VLIPRSRFHRVGLFVLIAGLALPGAYWVAKSLAAPPDQAVKRFENRPSRGLYWGGLRENPGGQCADALEVVDDKGNVHGCSHGPDPAPEGVDARIDTPPDTTDTVNDPAAAASVTSTSTAELSSGYVNCIDDGASGPRVQAIYARASDKADRYSTYLSTFRKVTSGVDNIFRLSAAQTGGYRGVRWVHDSSCRATIPNVTVSSGADDTFGNLVSALKAKGYNRSDRKYVVFVDNKPYCGMGEFFWDDRAGQDNYNNGPYALYSSVGSGCWTAHAAAHEITHTLGAVMKTAPHFNGHCYDGYDLMCYSDGGISLKVVCSTTTMKDRLDCGKNDYFHTAPASTNYLYNHWNTARNKYLTSTAFDTTPPTVRISSPADGSRIGSSTYISASASDNFKVYMLRLWVDGVRKLETTSSSFAYTWNSSTAATGKHTITVKAYDVYGNTRNLSYYVYR
jgi:hypothetical protein